MKQPVIIYGPAFSTYVRSVLLCCEEKGVAYNVEEIALRSKALLRMNPFGRVPVLKAGDHIVYESAAISQYIDTQYEGPALSPANAIDLVTMQQWTSIAICYLDKLFIRDYVLELAFPSGKAGALDDDKLNLAIKKIPQYLTTIERYLSNADYFSGSHPGIADYIIIPMLHYLTKAPSGEKIFEEKPKTFHYIKKMLDRKSCIKILK